MLFNQIIQALIPYSFDINSHDPQSVTPNDKNFLRMW